MNLFIFDILVFPLFKEWFEALNLLKIKITDETNAVAMLEPFNETFQNKHDLNDQEIQTLHDLAKSLWPWLNSKIIIEFDQYLYHELLTHPASIDFLPTASFFEKALYPRAYFLFRFEPYEGFTFCCAGQYLFLSFFGRIEGRAMMDHYRLDLNGQQTFESQVREFSHVFLDQKKIQKLCLLALQMIIFCCTEPEDSHFQDAEWSLPANLNFQEDPQLVVVGLASGQLIQSAYHQHHARVKAAQEEEDGALKPILKHNYWETSWNISDSKDPIVRWHQPTVIHGDELPKQTYH